MKLVYVALAATFLQLCSSANAQQRQTTEFSPIFAPDSLPYRLQLRESSFDRNLLPPLHSFASGVYDGKWLLIAGRTNGLHGFDGSGGANFPSQRQNRDVWVIDPISRQTWRRSLDEPDSGLSDAQIASLATANNQFAQVGERLYLVGGYGATSAGYLDTFDTLSAIDLAGLIDWTMSGDGTAAEHVRQIEDPAFNVTGGAMYSMSGRMHLVFGQDFQGDYRPWKNGFYTKQIRSFEIVDDGNSLSIANVSETDPRDQYRRRDLNVFPAVWNNAADEGLIALSGVFTENDGAWTTPVEIDASGSPTMADPQLSQTFKQSMNLYHAAKFGFYSANREEMHEILLGGITLASYDAASGQVTFDDAMPFTNQIAAVSRDSHGAYRQYFVGEFPELRDGDGARLRFGTNAQFFAAADLPAYGNGVLKFDDLEASQLVGYAFGGIVANAPHVRGNPNAGSAASDRLFEVYLVKVPEPSVAVQAVWFAMAFSCMRRRRVGAALEDAPARGSGYKV